YVHRGLAQALESRYFPAQPQQFAMKIQEDAMTAPVLQFMMQFGLQEGVFSLRIRWFAFPTEIGELLFSALPYGFDQLGVGVADEVLKRRHLSILIAHEQQRYERGQ